MSYYHIAKLVINNHHNVVNVLDLATSDQRKFTDYCEDMQKAFQESVKAVLKTSKSTEDDCFDAWKNYLVARGWTRGKSYSEENKTHPALVASLADVKDDVYILMFNQVYYMSEDMAYLIS